MLNDIKIRSVFPILFKTGQQIKSKLRILIFIIEIAQFIYIRIDHITPWRLAIEVNYLIVIGIGQQRLPYSIVQLPFYKVITTFLFIFAGEIGRFFNINQSAVQAVFFNITLSQHSRSISKILLV